MHQRAEEKTHSVYRQVADLQGPMLAQLILDLLARLIVDVNVDLKRLQSEYDV